MFRQLALRFVAFVTLVAFPAWAWGASKKAEPPAQVPAPVSYSTGPQDSVGVPISVTHAGLNIGVDYEYAMKKNIGVGAYVHYYPRSDNDRNPSHGYFMAGGQGVAHYTMDNWDAFMGAGFG